MTLLAPVAALGCFLLLLRGLVMVRSLPRYDLDDGFLLDTDLLERTSWVERLYGGLGRRTGSGLADLLGPRWKAWAGRMLAAAGQPRGFHVAGFAEFQGAYVTLGLVVATLFTLSANLPAGAFLGIVLAGYPSWWLWIEVERRQRQVERELPDFLDILAVTVSAGLSFRQALDRVGETLTGPLAEEVRRTLRRMDVGVRRRQAFSELRERNPRSKTMGLFVTALLQAEELGAPLADTLNDLARDLRREFSQEARRRAARAAPRVSLIITMVIMPGITAMVVTAMFLGGDFTFPGR